MTEGPIKNIPASIHQRLKNKAAELGQTFNEVLQHYALERFLYRLSISMHADQFILKGALLLRVWGLSSLRATRDIDLLGHTNNQVASVAEIMRSVCNVEALDDGLTFADDTVRAATITEDAEYEGVRVEFEGRLGNASIPMQVDIGFGDRVTPAPQQITYPSILGMASPKLRSYPPETSIAEKFQVMLQRGRLNSRMKDFFDIWSLARSRSFDGRVLSAAVRATCEHRQTPVQADPIAFTKDSVTDPSKAVQWRAFRARLRDSDCPQTFAEVAAEVARFLRPIATAIAAGTAFEGQWEAGGPWTGLGAPPTTG